MRAWHGTAYVGDWALWAGWTWMGTFPMWQMPVRYWWLYFFPRFRRWRIEVNPWPAHAFVEVSRSSRAIRGMTPVQIKWLVHQAFQELARGKERTQ